MASSQLQATDILELTLDQAFAPLSPSTKPESSTVPKDNIVAERVPQAPAPVEAVAAEGTSAESSDSWKTGYEAQVQSWRAQSADAREKAEKERLKWEALRAIEKEEAAKRKSAGFVDEAPAPWKTSGLNFAVQSSSQVSLQPSPIPVGPTSALARTPSQQDTTTTDESQTWEEVTSSFPSMSFPEQIDLASPANIQSLPSQPPPSVTLAMFDPSLSKRTRLSAFFSALTVNLVLPFINGVMLGFGEIFAKNVIMEWLGWKTSRPGSVATNVGLAGNPREHTIFR